MFYNESMPFSYDIEPNDSPRLRRHMSRVNSDDRLEVKALGPNLGQLARSAQVFDPNAYDGDGDGVVQDGTPFERPAVLSNIASVARGLASTTGGYGSYTPRGSWTVGLTNEQVAERAVPSTPAAFVEMMVAQQGSTGNLSDSVQKALDIAIFDEERVAELRDTLRNALDERPELRAAFDRFGCPPIGVHPNKDEDGEGIGYGGIAYGKQAIFITEKTLDKGAMSEWFGRRKFSAKVFSFTTFAPRVKGVDRAFTGESAEDIITHEWGHYLNHLVADIAPDPELRELAGALGQGSWYMSTYFTRIPPKVKRMFEYFDGAMKSGEKVDQPVGVPFVKSVYGTSMPCEFFAESVAAYFSPRRKSRELLNDEGIEIVEQMLGIRGASRSGFASRTGSLKSSTGSTLRGKTPQEIADIVVPKTKAEAIALSDAHNALLTDPDGVRYTASEPDKLKIIIPKGIDAMDFSPEAVSRMKEMVVEALSNNPEFHEAVQRFGMPPVLITKPGERLDGAYAIAGVEGFPAITIDSTMREQALAKGWWPNGIYEDEPFIKGTEGFSTSPTSEGFFIHEWAHYLNRLALDIHPDEEMRELARFWWNDTWILNAAIPRLTRFLRGLGKPKTRIDARYRGADKFYWATRDNKSVDFTGYPHVKTQYGQSQPAEAFAEAVAAVLSKDVDDKELVSPEMRRDVLDMLGFSPSVKEIDRAGSSEGRGSGFASKTVTRGPDGTRIINTSDPFTPLSGSDWLKDATDDEVADAVTPTSIDDAIALTIMNTSYGDDPANYPAEEAKVRQIMTDHIFKFYGRDSNGQIATDANGKPISFSVPYDFSPQGRQTVKDMVKRMMAESPEFSWMIRRFGCPPMMVIDEAKLTQLNNQVEQMRLAGQDISLPFHLANGAVGGFSVGTYGITLRPDPTTDNLPMGFYRGLAAKRKTGRIITNPDGSREEEKEHWMNNFGLSLADKAIHEWAHWFYATVKGNKGLLGKSRRGDRKSRLSYLFPGIPMADAEKMTKEFLDAFDADGFIPFNGMSAQYLERIMTTARRSINRNLGNKPLTEQLLADARFVDLINDYVNNVINAPNDWSPSQAQEFADQIAIEFPYLVDDMPPLIAGTYATATRQELWAEAILLFSSPDRKLKAKYLTPEIEAFIAYALGLKPDRDPSTPYQKPWAHRSGLSSSSRVRRLHAAQDSIDERVSDKDDGFASRNAGDAKSTTVKMSRETSSTSRFTVGDYEFDITDEDLSTYDWDTAYDQWTTWSGNWRMRHLSSAMMGIEQQPTKGGEESLSTVHEVMRSGELLDAPNHVKDSVRESLINTHKTMEKISMGDTVSDRPLYRGLGSVPDDSEILMAEQGETITFPLSAFTPDRGLATTFADMNAESDKKVILQLQNGAHVASSDYTTQIRDLESDWVEVPIESVTQGEFTVVSKREQDGYTVVELSHSKTFDPLSGKMVDTNVREGFASSSMRPERRVSDSAIRTLTDNMDFLRDNPPMGKGGKDLDDRWAEQTIGKLRSGEITQEDAFDLMNAVIEILSDGFSKDPSQKENPEGKLLAYQKLVKRLRKLAVGGMSKDDMDDLRREQGIIPTVTNKPKPTPYAGGRFGFSSTTRREELSTRAQERIDAIDAQVEELESFNRRLMRAISELQATGNWEGEKHDVFLKEGNSPKTYTKEQLESNGWTQRVREESARAHLDREMYVNSLKRERNDLEDSQKRLAGEYPETTMLVDELLLDEDNVESILARSLEVDSMSQQQRAERFTDPNDPNAVYVVHFGATKLEGGQLDPSRSRGQVGQGIAGNTRQINDETARYMVGLRDDAKRDLSILEEMKRQIETDGVIDFDAIARTDTRDSFRAGRARLLLGLNRRDPERSTHIPEGWQVSNIDGAIGDKNNVISRLDKVADQLIADDYQYTSTYRASALQDLLGSYGGRYAEGDSTEWGDNARRSTTTGIHIFKVRIGDDAVEQNSVGETHLVGKHTPIASLVVDSSANDDNPAREIWKGWLDSVIEQDIGKNNARRSGFASRASVRESSRVIGEDGDASKPSILGRAKDKLKLNDRQVGHINSMTNKMHSIFTSGKIYDEPIHPAIDDRRKELLDSIRVVRAEGGMTMIVAEPNPVFNAYLPVKRDWASIELPSREAVAEAIEKLKSNKGGRRSDTYGSGAFTDHLESLLQEIGKLGEGPGDLPYEGGEGNYISYVQQYYDSIRNPVGASRLLQGSDGMHDAFGHFGTGRGYDRHGEWANYLAMKDMIDASPLTDEEKEDAHRFWFREYGWLQFAKRGDLEEVDDNLRFMADDYDGPFSDILEIIDSGHNGLDDVPEEETPSGKTISDTSASELRQAARNDAEAQLEMSRSGFSSTTRDTGRNREVSAEYTQGIFGKLKALKERLGYGKDFEEKVSKEKLDTRIEETAAYAKRIIDWDAGKDVVLPQSAIDYIKDVVARNAFFTSDKRADGGASLIPIQAALSKSSPDVWPIGTPLPPSLALEISRQIHIARGDTEMVAKIDEFKNYLKTVTPEQLSEDIRAASLVYGESIDKRVLVRTRSVNPFIKGSRTILTQHDREEREAAGVESMNMMGDGITTSARRKVEANLLGLPFEEGVEDSPEVRELRPTSGYVTTSKTALARKEKFKEIYGDDVELMYDGPAGTALEHSQNNTGKYGPSQFVLRPAVAERTRVFDADTVDMSLKDNPPLQLSALEEDGIFLGGTTNPIGMLYDYKTGDTYPTPSGAFEGSSDTHSSQGTAASYKEALVLGRFKPEEVEAIIAAPADFRKEDGELSERLNPNNEANFSLLIDMARSRDELMQEHGIEVVPNIRRGVFKTDDVEMFNPAMTDVWFDTNFADKGLSKEEIVPDKSTTPYEAYLRVLIATGELPEMFEYRGPSGKSEEEKDAWKRDALKKELARVVSLKKDKEVSGTRSPGFSSRSSRASAKKITKNFKVNGKPRKAPVDRDELIRRAVPQNAADMMRIIEESPYMEGKKSKQEIYELINMMDIDWVAQQKMRLKLERVLMDSPAFEELLNEYDIPLMIITKSGVAKYAGGTGTLYPNSDRWRNIEGEYMTEYGFIAFPARVVDQETVNNAVSDGPLPTDDIIRHELSHTIHAMAMAQSKKARKKYEADIAEFIERMEDAIDYAERSGATEFDMRSVTMDPVDDALAGEISRYAQSKRAEYIAELLTHMLPGKRTKYVSLKDEHFKMLSEFLDIPIPRLRELYNKSMDNRAGWL